MDAIIAPGHTLGSVTDRIAHIALQRRTPLGWFVGFGIAFALLQLLLYTLAMLLFKGVGLWGINIPVGWGFDIINLGLVDRHRPRRHADLRHPAAAQAGLAHLHQPLRRGHDAVRRGLRGHLPGLPHRRPGSPPTG
jgi:hypothetical protein